MVTVHESHHLYRVGRFALTGEPSVIYTYETTRRGCRATIAAVAKHWCQGRRCVAVECGRDKNGLPVVRLDRDGRAVYEARAEVYD